MSERTETAMHISKISIMTDIILSAFKLFAGIFGRSGAMVSDAVHSLSDVFSTIIVMIGVRFSGKKADESHPYGHDRFESIASVILSAILIITGLGIGYAGIQALREGSAQAPAPGPIALAAAIMSIMVKETMFRYTRAGAKRVKSDALMADAWHHRSDALSSVGSLIGIGGAMLGWRFLDPLASIVICLFILKAAMEILFSAFDKMVDSAVDEDTLSQIKTIIMEEPGVRTIDLIKTRKFGNGFYVDVEISADADQSLSQAHDIAHAVHDRLEEEMSDLIHVMIHVNPYYPDKDDQ